VDFIAEFNNNQDFITSTRDCLKANLLILIKFKFKFANKHDFDAGGLTHQLFSK
jgi:hypothetical protein